MRRPQFLMRRQDGYQRPQTFYRSFVRQCPSMMLGDDWRNTHCTGGRLLRAAVRAGDQRSDQQHVSDHQQLLKQPSLVDSPPPALLSKLPVLRKPVKPNLQVSPLKVRIQLLCKQSFEAQNKRQSWYLLCDSGLKSLWEGDRIRVGGELFGKAILIDWLVGMPIVWRNFCECMG